MNNDPRKQETSGSRRGWSDVRKQRFGNFLVGLATVATGVTMTAHEAPKVVSAVHSVLPQGEQLPQAALVTLQNGAFKGLKEQSKDGIIPDEYVVYSVQEGDTIDEITRGLPFVNDEARDLGEKQLFVQGTPDGENAGQLQIGSKIVMLTEQFLPGADVSDEAAGLQNTGRTADGQIAVVHNPLGYQEISLPHEQ